MGFRYRSRNSAKVKLKPTPSQVHLIEFPVTLRRRRVTMWDEAEALVIRPRSPLKNCRKACNLKSGLHGFSSSRCALCVSADPEGRNAEVSRCFFDVQPKCTGASFHHGGEMSPIIGAFERRG